MHIVQLLASLAGLPLACPEDLGERLEKGDSGVLTCHIQAESIKNPSESDGFRAQRLKKMSSGPET